MTWTSVLKPRSLEHLRAKAASPGNIQRYFTELDGIIKKYDLTDKPHLIFYVDEKEYLNATVRLALLQA